MTKLIQLCRAVITALALILTTSLLAQAQSGGDYLLSSSNYSVEEVERMMRENAEYDEKLKDRKELRERNRRNSSGGDGGVLSFIIVCAIIAFIFIFLKELFY